MSGAVLSFAAARASKPARAVPAIRPALCAVVVSLDQRRACKAVPSPVQAPPAGLMRVQLVNAAGRLAPALVAIPAPGVQAALDCIANAVWL